MKQRTRTWWAIALAGAVAGAVFFIAFAATQVATRDAVTLESIYARLVTEDGRDRLGIIEEQLALISQDLEGITACTATMKGNLEDSSKYLEEQEWSLLDMRLLLDAMRGKIDTIISCLTCP